MTRLETLRAQVADLKLERLRLINRQKAESDAHRPTQATQARIAELNIDLRTLNLEVDRLQKIQWGKEHPTSASPGVHEALMHLAEVIHVAEAVVNRQATTLDLQKALNKLAWKVPAWRELAEKPKIEALPPAPARPRKDDYARVTEKQAVEYAELRRASFTPKMMADDLGADHLAAGAVLRRLAGRGLVTALERGLYIRARTTTQRIEVVEDP